MIKTYFPLGGGSTFNCTLDVESSEGAFVTVTGPDSFSGTIGSTGVIEFAITNPGSYTCTAILDSNTKTTTVDIETNGTTYTANCSLLKIVTWASGTDDEISAMVTAADAGKINLSDYWGVGDERTVSLTAMEATGVDETHVAQSVTFVLMNAGGKTLASATSGGKTTCNFVVGMKNMLANGTSREGGYMNSSNTNSGGWDSCARRTWCNNVFRAAVPSTLRGCFKQFNNITANGSSTSTATSSDYFALPSEKEIFGTTTYANSTAESSNTQFSYYATAANRIKKAGDSDSAYNWWERSPYSGGSTLFCHVYNDGSAHDSSASYARGLAPFGCI